MMSFLSNEQKRGVDKIIMEINWITSVAKKHKRKNQILFSKESDCLQELILLIENESHRTLVAWAFLCVNRPLEILKEHYPKEERPDKAVELCKLWAEGKVKMPIAKKALLEAHAVAKEIQSPEDIALCHGVGQACATVHVKSHAIGLPIYELTAIVRKHGVENCEKPVENRIAEYIDCLKACANDKELVDKEWAAFLK